MAPGMEIYPKVGGFGVLVIWKLQYFKEEMEALTSKEALKNLRWALE